MRASYRVSRLRTYSNAFLACAILCGGAVVVALTAPFFQQYSLAEVTTAMSPTAASQVVTPGTGEWNDDLDIENIFASDDVYAYTKLMEPSGFSWTLRATGFDFSQIPSTATIVGIEVRIERRASVSDAITDRTVRLFSTNGTSVENKASAGTWSDTDTVATYGGPSDLWGNLWTVDDITSGRLTVVFLAQNEHETEVARAGIDHISVVVTYTEPSDTTRPSAAVTSQISNPTAFSPIPLYVTFSEPVTEFAETDISLSGGVLHDFVALSESRYTFMVSPGSDPSPITVSVAADVAIDQSGNTNTAAEPYTITYDSTAPNIIVTSGPEHGSLLTTNQAQFSFTTTGDVTACSLDIEPFIGSNECTSFSDGSGTQELIDIPDGAHTLYIKAATSGRETLAQRSFLIDTRRPTVQLASRAVIDGWASSTPVQFTAEFSDPVTGFDGPASDMNISGGTLSGFMGSGSWYAFRVQTVDSSSITVTIPEGVAMKANGSNWTNEETSMSFSFDSQRPTLTIIEGIASDTATSSTSLTFAFSESDNVSTIVTCSIDGISTTTPCVSPYATGALADGDHTVRIVAIDPAGNATSTTRKFAIDATAPLLSEVAPIGTTTDTTPDYSFTSSEEGTLAVGGSCSASATSIASGTTTFALAELSIGTYSDCVIRVTDAVGNESAPLSISEFTIRAPDPAPASSAGNGPPISGGAPVAPISVQSQPVGQVLGESIAAIHTATPELSGQEQNAPSQRSTAPTKEPVSIELIDAASSMPAEVVVQEPVSQIGVNTPVQQSTFVPVQAAAVETVGSTMPVWMYGMFALALIFIAWKLLRAIFH